MGIPILSLLCACGGAGRWPYIFKGTINVAADFPTLAEVEDFWMYVAGAAVTDNDPTKTNTGQSFLAGDLFFWQFGTPNKWVTITASNLWATDGTTTKLITAQPINMQDDILYGSESSGGDLVLGSTSNVTRGDVQIDNGSTLSSLTPSYETLVTADNDIPNKKYVDDLYGTGSHWDRFTSPNVLKPKVIGDSVDLVNGRLTAASVTINQNTGNLGLYVKSVAGLSTSTAIITIDTTDATDQSLLRFAKSGGVQWQLTSRNELDAPNNRLSLFNSVSEVMSIQQDGSTILNGNLLIKQYINPAIHVKSNSGIIDSKSEIFIDTTDDADQSALRFGKGGITQWLLSARNLLDGPVNRLALYNSANEQVLSIQQTGYLILNSTMLILNGFANPGLYVKSTSGIVNDISELMIDTTDSADKSVLSFAAADSRKWTIESSNLYNTPNDRLSFYNSSTVETIVLEQSGAFTLNGDILVNQQTGSRAGVHVKSKSAMSGSFAEIMIDTTDTNDGTMLSFGKGGSRNWIIEANNEYFVPPYNMLNFKNDTGDYVITLRQSRRVGINNNEPAAILSILQPSGTGAIPVLQLYQQDLDQPIIAYEGQNQGVPTGGIVGSIYISVGTTKYRMAFYDV